MQCSTHEMNGMQWVNSFDVFLFCGHKSSQDGSVSTSGYCPLVQCQSSY